MILFIAVGLGGSLWIARQWAVYRRVPVNYEWNAVDLFLQGRASDDDLLIFDPDWLAGFAQDERRLHRYSVVTPQEIFQKIYPPASQLWLVSIFPRGPLAQRIQKAGLRLEESHSVHSVCLARYSLPSRNVAFHFTGHLAEARVFIGEGDGKVTEARKEGGAWTFIGNPADWNQVSVRIEPFRRRLRRCIWFHPLEEGVKTIEYSGVPVGKRMELFGGIVDDGIRTPPGAPVYLSVEVDGKPAGSLAFQDTDRNFYHLLDTASLSGEGRRVRFQVQTPDQGGRHFCFSASSLKE